MLRWLPWLILAHLLWGAVRLPGKALARRVDEIERYRRDGAEHWFLDRGGYSGADVVTWIRDNTPERCVVLWEGERLGAMEFAAALLAPRLFVRARPDGDDRTEHAGLPIATGSRDGAQGRIVLHAASDGLTLELR